MHHSWSRAEFEISTDPDRIHLDAVHAFLTNSYWAQGIPRETVERSLQHSVCFGVYEGKKQVGFARVISDCATFAYLADVFVLESHRRRGLAHWLMRCILEHPDLQGLRRWNLATRDAHRLYSAFGFTPLANPDRWMELHNAQIHAKRGQQPRS